MHAKHHILQLSLLLFSSFVINGAHTRKGVARSEFDLGPTMNIHSPYLVVNTNTTFSITCEGYHPIRWNSTVEMDDRAQVHERQVQKRYKSTLTIENAIFKDTGRISCYYECNCTRSDIKSSHIYVYVKDPNNLFVPSNTFVGNFGFGPITEGYEGVIPCRPTDPSINLTLIKFPSDSQVVHLQEDDIEYDPTQGFIIRYPNIFFTGLFECMAVLDKRVESREYHMHYFENGGKPPHPYIKNKITAFDVKDAKVKLTCVVNVKPNSTVNIKWTYPNIKNDYLLVSDTEEQLIQSANGYNFVKLTSVLEVTNITSSDGGRYSCFSVADNGKYEEDFVYIPIESVARVVSSNMDGSVLNTEIDDEIKLTCVVDGYPKPSIQWFKNGVLIDENIDRRYSFLDHQFVFIIDEVISSDAGLYSCLTFNRLGSATRNVTVNIIDVSLHQQHRVSQSTSISLAFSIKLVVLNLFIGLLF